MMELTDNCFRLTGVSTKGDRVYIIIELLTDENETAQCYLENYYEGLYIGKGNERYQIFAEKRDIKLTGEIYYDSIVQNAVSKQDNLMCLWVRLRVSNTLIEQMVQIGTGAADIAFGYRDFFQFVPVSDYEFYIFDCRNCCHIPTQNPIRDIRDREEIRDVRISISENTVRFTAGIDTGLLQEMEKEAINKELCLVWKDTKTKLTYYFHPERIIDGRIDYCLERGELDQMGRMETDGRYFDWVMADADGREYRMYGADENGEKEWILPSRDISASLRQNADRSLSVKMVTTIFFHYRGADEDGSRILLEFRKKTYPITVTTFLAQRVNTDLVYQLPYVVLEEDDQKILYAVEMKFDVEEKEFRIGIYQFWVELQDGIAVNKHPLKLYRGCHVRENTYLIAKHPYTVIGGRYYNCLFYNDTSNNFKCNILPKKMKIQILGICITADSECLLTLMVQKEPFFCQVTSVCLEAENGELLSERVDVAGEDQGRITVEIRISLQRLYKMGKDLMFRPMLSVQGREGWIYVENNCYAPAVPGRETRRLSKIRQVGNLEFRRIWGDHIGHSYAIGVSENLCLLTETGYGIEDGKIVVKIGLDEKMSAEADRGYKYDLGHLELEMAARDMLTEEVIMFDRIHQENELVFAVPVSKLRFSEYLLFGQFENGMISYLAMSAGPLTLYAYEEKRKLAVRKAGGAMIVSLSEILIYEDEARSRQCRAVIEKAQADKAKMGRKIWLVGENYGLSARDNGLAFFEYCMENQGSVEAEVYYVIKKESEDGKVLEAYREHVLIYDSDSHIYYDELAEFYIVSHGVRDVMPSLYHDRAGVYRKPVIYLQHGIAAMKKFNISNQSYGGSIRRFIVSSKQEEELMIQNRQFWEDEIAVTGIARHDKLSAGEGSGGKYIWVMPTWRDWLVSSEREFRNSVFYRYYSELLGDAELYQNLKQYGQRLVFSLHIEFEKYRHFFDKFENDLIHIADMHEKKISECIRECSMMVTDYSSIVFDAVYLGKPVTFFQFDQAEYHKYRGSYVDLETSLPGKVDHFPYELKDTLIGCIQEGFPVRPEYKSRAEKYFDFHDGCNAERIYNTVIECREEMAGEH